MSGRARLVALAALAAIAACGDPNPAEPPTNGPAFLAITRAGNGLMARVAVNAAGFDSVRVSYSAANDTPRSTPAVRVTADSLELRVLGLKPATTYAFQLEGWQGGVLVAGPNAGFTSDSLPAPLKLMELRLTGTPTSGMTLLPTIVSGVPYVLLFDSAGTIRWYLDVSPWYPGVRPNDVRQLPNGNIMVNLCASPGWTPVACAFYEFTLEGGLVRLYTAPAPLYTDNHDILLSFPPGQGVAPSAWVLFGYDIRTTDVSAYGGAASVQLAGHQVIRQRAIGSPELLFNAWDRISLLDWIDEPQSQKQGPQADFDHPNAIALDTDGHYVVSWRSLGEISKINAFTGAYIWRLGGRNNQFTFVNDPLGLFSGQHAVKALGNNHYLLYDNGLRHAPPESRVVEYALDTLAHTATMVWEYRHTPAIYTPFVGWVQRLPNGNTFIGWGGVARVQEVTAGKQTLWEGQLFANNVVAPFYRAIRIVDLYTWRAP